MVNVLQMKIVITGGPCSGKTTVIKHLEKEGYKVLHEVPREVILEYKKLGKDHSKNVHDFQYDVLKRTIERNKMIKEGELTFLDIDIPEGVAYFKIRGMKPPEWLISAIKEHAKYHKVILLEQAPFFEKDGVRVENEETSKKISKIIEKTYRELGYEIYKVPFMELRERVKVIKKICGLNS
ncbi:MAG: ATP-binding protein [Nanoarchaeota archaeon]|nr:ATP-binding protein [Nanoarchaeota archaeon]